MTAQPAPIARALSINEVIERTGFCRAKVYEHIRGRELIARKSGRRTFVLESDLQDFLLSMPRVELRGVAAA